MVSVLKACRNKVRDALRGFVFRHGWKFCDAGFCYEDHGILVLAEHCRGEVADNKVSALRYTFGPGIGF